MLRDVIASSGLVVFAEVALIIFFFTFMVVVVRVLRRDRSHYDPIARQPLDDEPPDVQGDLHRHDPKGRSSS